jgi:hypothetical protein
MKGWKAVIDIPGKISLKNEIIYKKKLKNSGKRL